MTGARRQRPGFTLIELLIVAAIFSISALLATTVFTNVQSRQGQIQSKQRVSADGRYVVETIARSIRTGSFNYAMFTNGVVAPNPTPKISTVDQDGKVTCYRLNSTAVEVATNAAVNCPDTPAAAWTAFTPADLQVDTLSFFVTPLSSPLQPLPRSATDCKQATPITDGLSTPTIISGFDQNLGACICRPANVVNDCFSAICSQTGPTKTICTNPNVQPQVTIFIRTHSTNTAAGEQAKGVLQTTVVSRVYQ